MNRQIEIIFKNFNHPSIRAGHNYNMAVSAHVIIQIRRKTTNILPGSSSCKHNHMFSIFKRGLN